MILESLMLSWPGAHFKAGPWSGFITRCWDLKIRLECLPFSEFISREIFQILTCWSKNGSRSISYNSKSLPSHSGAISIYDFASRDQNPLFSNENITKSRKKIEKYAWAVPGNQQEETDVTGLQVAWTDLPWPRTAVVISLQNQDEEWDCTQLCPSLWRDY